MKTVQQALLKTQDFSASAGNIFIIKPFQYPLQLENIYWVQTLEQGYTTTGGIINITACGGIYNWTQSRRQGFID